MSGTTVRISEASRDVLRELSRSTCATMQEVMEKALLEYKKRLFWDQAAQDFTALGEDPEAWRTELAERELWDATLGDGLDPEDAP